MMGATDTRRSKESLRLSMDMPIRAAFCTRVASAGFLRIPGSFANLLTATIWVARNWDWAFSFSIASCWQLLVNAGRGIDAILRPRHAWRAPFVHLT
jgi:hypothetical protein